MTDERVDERLLDLLGSRPYGVLTTIKRDGQPQLSNVLHQLDRQRRVFRVSLTAGRAKTANLRRDPRTSLHVSSPDGWAYAVAEGVGELTPVAADPDDATVAELVDLYRTVAGEHPDWAEYRRAMVADRRLVLRVTITHLYGLPPR